MVNIDLSASDPLKSKWVLRNTQQERKHDDKMSSAYSFAMTSVFSKKSKRSDVDQILAEKQQEIQRVKQIDDYLEKSDVPTGKQAVDRYFNSIKNKNSTPQNNDSQKEIKQQKMIKIMKSKPSAPAPDHTFNIITNSEEKDKLADDEKWHLVRKQRLEYPNYGTKYSDADVQKMNEYNFRPQQKKVEIVDSPVKRKEIPSYIKSVLGNKESIQEVIAVMKELLEVRIDYRMLYILRETLIKNSQEHHTDKVTVDDFRSSWQTLMSQEKHDQHPHVEFKVLGNLTN